MFEQVFLPNIGSFEVSNPILCSRPLVFGGDKTFTAYNSGLALKESPFPFDKLSVEFLKFCPHLHTTHAETDAHVKIPDSNGLQAFHNYLSP
jgi:hypothetical protein